MYSIIKCYLRHILAVCVVSLCVMTGTAALSVKLDVDWPQFMSKQDMVWETLPEYWYESAYMGNGMLGLMIYKEPGQNYIRLETGNCAVHDHRKGKNDLFSIGRLLTGHFALHPKGEILDGKMRVDLWNAETTADIVTTKGKIHLHSFVHSDKMIIVTKTTTEGEEKDFRWEWVPAPSESPRYLFAKGEGNWIKVPEDYPLNPAPEVTGTEKEGMSYQKLQAGGETAVAWKETVKKGERVLWVNLTHSYPESNAREISRNELEDALRCGYKNLQKTHRQWWNAYYPASFLTLPEGVKENFYWIQMYKLASATRADRALIDCTGPWLTKTPWPNAWWNLNVQLTYWPLNASDRLDLAASLENALYNNVEQLRKNIPEAYRHDALGLGRTSNFYCATEPVGIPGVSKTAEVGLLTWACHNLWLIYRHKMDDALLRDKLFPLLKGAVNYYLHFLQKEEDGKLHLPATYSPEYGSAEDCNFDLSLLRWGCLTLIQSAERLKIDDPLLPKWKTVLEELTPYPMDENGLFIGRNTPYAFSHRHYSHLLAAYPLYTLNKEHPEDVDLIERSLHFWQSKTGAHQGYSLTGASSILSALGKGNDALVYLNKLFGRFLSVNTLYRESGPVIETPLSGAQSIHDMLLQSWGGKIRVFPAVPDAWQDVAFDGLRTEGAFKVSANRKAGKTEFIQVKSLAGEPCILVTDIARPFFKGKRHLEVKQLGEHTYQVDLQKGEEMLVYPEGTSPDLIIHPIQNTSIHCFGKKLKDKK